KITVRGLEIRNSKFSDDLLHSRLISPGLEFFHPLEDVLHFLSGRIPCQRLLIRFHYLSDFILLIEQEVAQHYGVGHLRILIKNADAYPLSQNRRPFIGRQLSRKNAKQR